VTVPDYSSGRADMYDSLGIRGTTYEIGFDAVAAVLGDLRGKVLLDFGSGTGRSAAFLRALGAELVYGVDHDPAMVRIASAKGLSGVKFLASDRTIPLPTASVAAATSLNVFIEIRSRNVMEEVCTEVARVLQPGGSFVVMSTNPEAFGKTFRTFSYSLPTEPVGGSLATCTVDTVNGPLLIEDTYWQIPDYLGAFTRAGFDVIDVAYPRPRHPEEWDSDEAVVAPFVIFHLVRA